MHTFLAPASLQKLYNKASIDKVIQTSLVMLLQPAASFLLGGAGGGFTPEIYRCNKPLQTDGTIAFL